MVINAYSSIPIFLFVIVSTSLKLTKTQVEFISQLNKNFAINNLVVLSNHYEETYSTKIYLVKYLSAKNMQTAFMSSTQWNSSMFTFAKLLILLSDEDDLFRIFTIQNEFYHWAFWMIFDADESSLEKAYIPYNCEFLNVKTLNSTVYELTEVYNPMIYDKTDYKIYGNWKDGVGFDISLLDFYARRFNMNKSVLGIVARDKVTVCNYHPKPCAYEEIMGEISRVMNFKTTYLTSKDYQEFIQNKTDNIFFEVELGEYVFHSFTFDDMNMVAPIWKTQAFLHIAYDKSYEQGYSNPHTQPFSKDLWIIVGFCIFASSLVAVSIHYAAFKLKFHDWFSFVCYWFLPFEAFTNQCGSEPTKLNSSKIVFFATRLAPWFIVSAYSGAILSFVTVKLVKIPFTDLKGLINDDSFKIGYRKGFFLELFFNKATDELSKTASEKFMIDLYDMPQNGSVGIEKMCEDHKFAFLYFNNDAYRRRTDCKIIQIPTPVMVAWDGFKVRPLSPYKLIFHRILKTLFSSGVLKKMMISVNGDKPIEEVDDEPDPVDLTSLLPLYHFIIYLYFIAVFIYFLECIGRSVVQRLACSTRKWSVRGSQARAKVTVWIFSSEHSPLVQHGLAFASD